MSWAAHQLAYWSQAPCVDEEHDAIRDHDSLWYSPAARPVGVWWDDTDTGLELRNCNRCDSTLAREVPRVRS